MSSRLKLGLIFFACAAPFLLGWLAYEYRLGAGESGNYGELLQPQAVSGPLTPLRGKWVLVTFDTAACAAACEKKLYIVRQLRRGQGKEQERIERLWVLTDSGKPRNEVLTAIEGSHVAADANLAFPGKREDHIYLVDPLGNLMMRFPSDPEPAKMIKDLQRLLKYSRFG
ncbi:MAG TPA: cytochrome C oxidase subunit I [Burkholderiales bacterium]|nr:cytochrome C oxidase subunit I [Burkholderiales bacterium]